MSNLVQDLLTEKWNSGLNAILHSHTTDNMYLNMSPEGKVNLIHGWMKAKKTLSGELWKTFEEVLIKKPYSIVTMMLTLSEEDLLNQSERKHIIEKVVTDLSLTEYALFKQTPYFPKMFDSLANWDSKGNA